MKFTKREGLLLALTITGVAVSATTSFTTQTISRATISVAQNNSVNSLASIAGPQQTFLDTLKKFAATVGSGLLSAGRGTWSALIRLSGYAKDFTISLLHTTWKGIKVVSGGVGSGVHRLLQCIGLASPPETTAAKEKKEK